VNHTLATRLSPTPAVQRDWSSAVSVALVGLFTVELIIGGPGYWSIGGISVRRTLVVLLTVWFLALWAFGRLRVVPGHLVTLAFIAMFLLVWVVLVPVMHDAYQLPLAAQEGLPVALLFPATLAHAYFRARPEDWLTIRRIAGRTLTAAAIGALLLWVVGTFSDIEPFAVALAAQVFFTMGNADVEAALFIHEMPDGFFRVMWITSVLFVPGLLYALAARRPLGCMLFTAALFVSYTRALWLAAMLGILVALIAAPRRDPVLRRRPAAMLLMAAAISVAVFGGLGNEPSSLLSTAADRIAATFSDDSAADRFTQFQPLVEAWQDRPLFGAGFGSAAGGSSRSDVAPYLYELTYVALLMKVGVIGWLALLAGTLLMVLLRRRAANRYRACALGAIGSFLAAAGTNPYLLNLVGMGLLAFLVIELDLASSTARVPRRR
jgi:O-antigen ligase